MKDTLLLYDSLNAKNSSLDKIAENFVSSSEFIELTKNRHNVVLGPRGCGKTTAFKMLTTPALMKWQTETEMEKALKENIPFVAIYIPADELWKKQFESFMEELQGRPEVVSAISNAIITTNVLANYCMCITDHIQCKYGKDQSRESEFAKNLCKEWMIDDTAYTLSAVYQGLTARKSKLLRIIGELMFNKELDVTDKLNEPFFLDFIIAIRLGSIAFERIYNEGKSITWALCFDELELVSDDFFSIMIKKLRVAPSNLLFKLSTGPLADFSKTDGQLLHDFDIVKMWPYNSDQERKYRSFCEKIAVQKLRKHFSFENKGEEERFNLTDVVGELDYNLHALKDWNFSVDPNAQESEKNSLTWHVFKKLAEIDTSFEYVLSENKINSENPIPKTTRQSDTFFRKIKEIAINRLVFKRYNPGSQSINAPLKIFPIYYGRKTILSICEGNPRFLLGIVGDLFGKETAIGKRKKLLISPQEQSKKLMDISDRYFSMVSNYPTQTKNNPQIDLRRFVKTLGNYFDQEINSGPFKLNPVNSFYVDENNLSDDIQELLRVGVGLGAFVKIDNELNIIHPNFTKTRYRLCYLLAPQFRLPLRLYAPRNLSTIINNSDKNQLKLL